MSNLEPITRKEQYLNRLTGEEQAIPEEPITRTEQYLAKLCGEETEIPSSPITREEAYLAYLNGEDVTLPEPITRLEQFMAYAASKSETKPTPVTREEFYWDKYQGGAVLKDFPDLPASIVTVTDALAKPLNSLKVAITPVQSGSGDPSPDNIRPISGWTGANVTRCGKNIVHLKDATRVANGTYRMLTVSNELVSVSATGSVSSNSIVNSSAMREVCENRDLPPGTYSFSVANLDTNNSAVTLSSIRLALNDDTLINNGESFTLTSAKKIGYITNSSQVTYNANTYIKFNLQIERSAQVSEYEPYTGQDYPITFPSEAGTVYGGTLDVTNGTLTVTDVIKTLSGDASEEWSALSVEGAFFLENCFVGAPSDMKTSANSPVCLCNMYKESSSISNSSSMVEKANNVFCNQGRGEYYKRLFIKDTRFTDVNDFTQMLSSQNLKVVYPLATPITYQLTPTEVQMLLGTNNIWADTGDILEGKYWSKNPVTVTRAMLNTLRDAGEIAEITPEEPEEPEENADER